MISIVIPSHNRKDTLRRAVDSALAQERPLGQDYEIVIIDGGSVDGAAEYLDELRGLAHVHVEKLRRDPGMIPCWYLGAAVARGDWIHFLPDDDWIEPTFLHRCALMLADDVGCVMTDGMIRFADGTSRQNLMLAPTGHYLSSLIRDALIHAPLTFTPACALVRRSAALDFLEVARIPHTSQRTRLHDCHMMLGAISSGDRCAWINEPLVNLGVVEDGITAAACADDGGVRLSEQYAEIKAAWVRNFSGYGA